MPAIDERGPFRAAAGSFRFANGTDVAELYFVRTAVTLKVLGHFDQSRDGRAATWRSSTKVAEPIVYIIHRGDSRRYSGRGPESVQDMGLDFSRRPGQQSGPTVVPNMSSISIGTPSRLPSGPARSGGRAAVGTPIGLDVLDASDVLQDNLQFEVDVNRPNEGEGPTGAK